MIRQFNNFSIDLNGKIAYYCIEQIGDKEIPAYFIIYPLFMVHHVDMFNPSFNNMYLAAPREKLDIYIQILYTNNVQTLNDLAVIIRQELSQKGTITWYDGEYIKEKLGIGMREPLKPEYLNAIYKNPFDK